VKKGYPGKLPIIDVSPLFDANNTKDLLALAKRFKEVYTEIGFAYIVNHNISPYQMKSVFEQARLFHHLPEEEKLKIVQNPFFRGYMPFATSILKVSTLGEAVKPNQSAAFILGHEVSDTDPDYKGGINLAGPNQWPSENLLPEFKSVLLHYRENATTLVKDLIRVFSLSLGQHYYALDPYFTRPTTFLRLQHYPAQPEHIPDQQYGIAPHTDYGFLTLLANDDLGGLEVQSTDGTWIDMPPLPGAFVLNVGDMFRRISNDVYISTPHRVINRFGKERYSIPFFFEPNMHAHIVPMLANATPKYESIEYSTYLMKRIKGNYEIGAQ